MKDSSLTHRLRTAVFFGLQAILEILGSPQTTDRTAGFPTQVRFGLGCKCAWRLLLEVRVGHVQTLSVNALSSFYRSAKLSPTRTAPVLMPTVLLNHCGYLCHCDWVDISSTIVIFSFRTLCLVHRDLYYCVIFVVSPYRLKENNVAITLYAYSWLLLD